MTMITKVLITQVNPTIQMKNYKTTYIAKLPEGKKPDRKKLMEETLLTGN